MKSTLPDPYQEFVPTPEVANVARRAPLRRLWVRLRRDWLDFLIARGADPLGSPTLQLRIRQLTDRRMRERLRRRIESALRSSRGERPWSLFPRPEPVCVDAARAELAEIAEILGDAPLVYARGVAMASALLRDFASPLFDTREAVSTWYWAQLTIRALEGHV